MFLSITSFSRQLIGATALPVAQSISVSLKAPSSACQTLFASLLSTAHPGGMSDMVDDINRELTEFFGQPLDNNQQSHMPGGPKTPAEISNHTQVPTSIPKPAGFSSPLTGQALHSEQQATSRAETRLTHVDDAGRASMVDVSGKQATAREATASVRVLLGPTAFALVAANRMAKGDVLATARLAGVMAAKQTAAVVPLCHNIALSHVEVSAELDPHAHAVCIRSTARTVGTTGVEMEALMAAAGAALTVYDMCKAVTKAAVVTDLRLEHKAGGKSGTWRRTEP